MKKLILSFSAVAGLALAGHAQGTINFDATVGSGGFVSLNGVATTADINAELLYSATGAAGSFTPVVTLLLSSSATFTGSFAAGQTFTAAGDVNAFGGQLYDNNGIAYQIPGTSSGATGFFEIQGWTGLGVNSYAAAAAGAAQFAGTTSVFSEVLASTTGSTQGLNNAPNLNLAPTTIIPEPSTLAMAGIGLASMLFLRRKTK